MKLYDPYLIKKENYFLSLHLKEENIFKCPAGEYEQIHFKIFDIFKKRFDDLFYLIMEAERQQKRSVILYMLADKFTAAFRLTLLCIAKYLDGDLVFWNISTDQMEISRTAGVKRKKY